MEIYRNFFTSLLRLGGITPNNTPDNESNGYQLVSALQELSNRYNTRMTLEWDGSNFTLDTKLGTIQNGVFFLVDVRDDMDVNSTVVGTDNVTLSTTTRRPLKQGDFAIAYNSGSGLSFFSIYQTYLGTANGMVWNRTSDGFLSNPSGDFQSITRTYQNTANRIEIYQVILKTGHSVSGRMVVDFSVANLYMGPTPDSTESKLVIDLTLEDVGSSNTFKFAVRWNEGVIPTTDSPFDYITYEIGMRIARNPGIPD